MAAAALGALLFIALYGAVAAQQFTRYAAPTGMDLTTAGIVRPHRNISSTIGRS